MLCRRVSGPPPVPPRKKPRCWRKRKLKLNLRSKDVALTAVYAALYVALVVVLGPFSYGPVQIRIADTMLAAVPLLGIAGVLGHTLGVFTANIFSTVGVIDLLNTIPSFVMAFVVHYVYRKTGNAFSVILTCLSYSAVIGTTVGWMLSYVYNLPLLVTIGYVTLGNIIATVAIGYPVFMLLKKAGIAGGFVKSLPPKEANP
jgi:uncharacterized membrane protein